MKVANWELFADELRAALIKLYPAITWRVTPDRRGEVAGVSVAARRLGTGGVAQIWVDSVTMKSMTLHDLLEAIHAEAERQLADQRDR